MSHRRHCWIAAFVITFCLGGITGQYLVPDSRADKAAGAAPESRYQLVGQRPLALLFDHTTGQTWAFAEEGLVWVPVLYCPDSGTAADRPLQKGALDKATQEALKERADLLKTN